MTGRFLTSAVFDCTTFAQALINPNGPAGACVKAAQFFTVKLFISDYVLREIRELPEKLPLTLGVTQERTEAFIRDLAKYTEILNQVPKIFSYERDEDDAPYIDLAHASKSAYLVSRDRDLLDLMRSETPVGHGFLREFPGLRIVNPPAFLQELARLEKTVGE